MAKHELSKDELDRNVYLSIKEILTSAREKAYKAVNFAMVEAYWYVGKLIVEAQDGNERAEYGDYLLKNLSKELTKEFGKGFTITNLKYMRQFYLAFSKGHTLCDQLSWSHYRTLLSLPDENMIEYYIKIIIEQELSVRKLRKNNKNILSN